MLHVVLPLALVGAAIRPAHQALALHAIVGKGAVVETPVVPGHGACAVALIVLPIANVAEEQVNVQKGGNGDGEGEGEEGK